MNAYQKGFIKRAAQYGVSRMDAIAILHKLAYSAPASGFGMPSTWAQTGGRTAGNAMADQGGQHGLTEGISGVASDYAGEQAAHQAAGHGGGLANHLGHEGGLHLTAEGLERAGKSTNLGVKPSVQLPKVTPQGAAHFGSHLAKGFGGGLAAGYVADKYLPNAKGDGYMSQVYQQGVRPVLTSAAGGAGAGLASSVKLGPGGVAASPTATGWGATIGAGIGVGKNVVGIGKTIGDTANTYIGAAEGNRKADSMMSQINQRKSQGLPTTGVKPAPSLTDKAIGQLPNLVNPKGAGNSGKSVAAAISG